MIEKVLDPEAGVFKIRPMGYEPKVLHQSNIRPIKERGAEDVIVSNIARENEEGNSPKGEMMDMAEVLSRFGIDGNEMDSDVENRSPSDLNDSEVEGNNSTQLPELRRSERIKNLNRQRT